MIGADNQLASSTGDRVLGGHADAGFHVAAVEIAHRFAESFSEFVCESINGVADVEVNVFVRLDELHGQLHVFVV